MIDVHELDGKLIDIKVSPMSDKVKKVAYDMYEFVLNNDEKIKKAPFYNDALEGFRLIKNDHGNAANYDSSNNKHAEDIFAHIIAEIAKTKDTNVLYILSEQLADMAKLGRCPQGRCTRLLQIYISMKSPVNLPKKNTSDKQPSKNSNIVKPIP